MNVIRKSHKKNIAFRSLKPGDTFLFNEQIFIKTVNVDGLFGGVQLSNGQYSDDFSEYTMVVVVTGSFVEGQEN